MTRKKKMEIVEVRKTYTVGQWVNMREWMFCPEFEDLDHAVKYLDNFNKNSRVYGAYVIEVERRTWSNGMKDRCTRRLDKRDIDLIEYLKKCEEKETKRRKRRGQ